MGRIWTHEYAVGLAREVAPEFEPIEPYPGNQVDWRGLHTPCGREVIVRLERLRSSGRVCYDCLPPREKDLPCTAEGCSERRIAKGLCRPHYNMQRDGRELIPLGQRRTRPRKPPKPCAAGDYCDRLSEKGGFCEAHYQQYWKEGRLRPLRGQVQYYCLADGCDRPAPRPNRGSVGPLCVSHQDQYRRSGTLGPLRYKAPDHEPLINEQGYRSIWVGGQRVLEHRHVMSQVIGRELRRDETVHHRNGDRADNRVENLELWSSYQPPGQRILDKLFYACEIFEAYGDLSEDVLLMVGVGLPFGKERRVPDAMEERS